MTGGFPAGQGYLHRFGAVHAGRHLNSSPYPLFVTVLLTINPFLLILTIANSVTPSIGKNLIFCFAFGKNHDYIP
jgi:hypothetical protein